MTVEQLIEKDEFELISKGTQMECTIEDIFCCDLLSVAMSKAPAGGAWVTVMANVNTLAVASLTETALIVLAEGVKLPADTVKKAWDEGITVLSSQESVYHTAKRLDQMIHEDTCL